MAELKLTSWNIEKLDRLMQDSLDHSKQIRLEAIVREILEISPDILCLIEGPNSEARIDKFTDDALGGEYVAVKEANSSYKMGGTQWIWFLVKDTYKDKTQLQSPTVWDNLTEKSWLVNYWGDFSTSRHRHYRHPQVMVLDWNGHRVEFIGLHLKSKFVKRGEADWNAGGQQRQGFITEAIKARIKLATEASNVRSYIEAKFEQVEKPAIFVMGDLNDGPGKEYFERRYLFFDLVSNVQGDVFFANRFLNHALFDYSDHLRWSVHFDDFVDPARDPHILLDHILFTQGLVDGSLPLVVKDHSGFVEHEVHDLINAPLSKKQKTSDHEPISLVVSVEG